MSDTRQADARGPMSTPADRNPFTVTSDTAVLWATMTGDEHYAAYVRLRGEAAELFTALKNVREWQDGSPLVGGRGLPYELSNAVRAAITHAEARCDTTPKGSEPFDPFGPIPPISADNTIPAGAKCQEASTLSHNFYIPCMAPAVAIVFHDRDRRGYYMCAPCASHNCRNRGGRLITQTPESVATYGKLDAR